MNNALLKVYVKLQCLIMEEEGQDMVEYGLVVALIGLGSIVTMKAAATSFGTMFSNLASIAVANS
jgi:pilus assembly protein Flp/PilA